MADLTITDGGIETHMIFLLGRELKNFALFECLKDPDGKAKLTQMYKSYLKCAQDRCCKMQLGSPTWRASSDHMAGMGYDVTEVAEYNRRGVEFMRSFREAHSDSGVHLTISGDVGPRGDGYVPDSIMTIVEAKEFHSLNIGGLSSGGAELIQALTINYWQEAAGIVLAAKDVSLPVTISFVVETDGKLVHGMALQEAIQNVDEATNGYATHFGINCAHPTHFSSTLADMDTNSCARIKQIRVNASKCTHAELDEAEELDCGDVEGLAKEVAHLKLKHGLTTVGGCCGTDNRHIEAMAKSILSL